MPNGFATLIRTRKLVRTFDADRWDYYKRVPPEPVPYFTYGILTRFMAKNSTVLDTSNPNTELDVAAIQSPRGNLTVYVLNSSEDYPKHQAEFLPIEVFSRRSSSDMGGESTVAIRISR